MPSRRLFHGVGYFAEAGARARRFDGKFEEVALSRLKRSGYGREPSVDVFLVPVGAQFREPRYLRVTHGAVVDFEDVDGIFLFELQGVDADDLFTAGVNAGLAARRRLFDAHLWQAGFYGLGHAAEGLDLLDVSPGAADEFVGERLDVVGAAPRVDDFADAGLVLDVELGVSRDTGREVGRQRDGFVKGVGVERLCVAEGRRHRLDAGARDVVEGVLCREAPA